MASSLKGCKIGDLGHRLSDLERRPSFVRCKHDCYGHTRHLVLVLGTLSLAIVLACVISFNPAIVVMMDLKTSPLYLELNSTNSTVAIDYNSGDIPLAQRRFDYTNVEKSLLLASAFGGCLVFFVPVTIAMQRFDAWRTQLTVGLIVCTATALIPFAATTSFTLLCAARFFTGLAITNLFPVVGSIVGHWSPLKERGLFLAILSGYIQLSVVISFPLSGFLAQTVGWPWVFYVHAALGFLSFAGWALLYRDHPQTHAFVSKEELMIIEVGQAENVKPKQCKPPYLAILRSSSIGAILVAVVGNFSIIQFANTFLPMYLRSALDYSISSSGMISAVPLFLQFLVKWLTGYTTDHLPNVSDLLKVKLCNSLAFCGSAFFFLATIGFSMLTSSGLFPVLTITGAIAVLGLSSGGFTKSVVLVSKQHTPAVMAILQMTLAITLFTGSFVIPAMTKKSDEEHYDHVFWLYVGILLFTNTVFLIWGKTDAAEWTKV